jgi:hypothetical protein
MELLVRVYVFLFLLVLGQLYGFAVFANRLILETGFEKIKKPGLNNTGPYNESLLEASGSITVREEGAVIENVDITERIKIEANNVTIRNFKINAVGTSYGIIANLGYTGLQVEDGEIFNMNSAAILGTGFTVLRLNIHDSGGDGIKAQGGTEPTFVAYSWIHHLGKLPSAHADGN